MKAIWNNQILAKSDTKPEAKEIENHVAFWKGVEITA